MMQQKNKEKYLRKKCWLIQIKGSILDKKKGCFNCLYWQYNVFSGFFECKNEKSEKYLITDKKDKGAKNNVCNDWEEY